MLIPIKLPSQTDTTIKGYHIRDFELSERCILIESKPAKEILTNHFLVSTPLVLYSREAVKDCIRFFFTFQNVSCNPSEIVDVVPLSGSLTYDVYNAFYELFQQPLQRNFIGIRRFQKSSGIWDTEVSYTNFEGLSHSTKVVLIGDTIATGATITQIIRLVQAQLQAPTIFVIISIAGSLVGAKRLVKLEKTLQNTFPGTEIWCLFTEAYFGLEANGTDMPIFHPDTISTESLKRLAHDKLGKILGRYLCSVLDWGKRTNSPLKHLSELRETLERFSMDKKDEFYHIMLNECNKHLSSFKEVSI
ncbi:MAG: phosphoribosyltransferase [Candidatus Heimdallarchaeota archaeon]|nr:MAG: phosphoribosyltransferase [Candidatus Heimdallarchaeota archaeon]